MINSLLRKYWGEYRRRIVGATVFVVVLVWVYSTVFTQSLPVEGTILFTVVFIGFAIEMLVQDVLGVKERVESMAGRVDSIDGRVDSIERLSENVDSLRSEIEAPPNIFPNVDEANAEIDELIEEGQSNEVYFLEYNGLKINNLVNAAISKNCRVYLLVKDPVSAINSRQKQHIISNVIALYEQHYDYDRLRIHFYTKPASMKMRKIGDSLICLGWYTFENRPNMDRDHPIWGNDNPMVCVPSERNPNEFKALDEWFKRIYHTRWKNGRTLADLYASENCPEQLRSYVNSGSREEMETWIERVSGRTDIDRDELFEL